MRKIIPYNKKLVPLAKKLRQDMTLSEVLLWNELKGKSLGVRFSRQIPIDEFIVDFYCKDLQLAIEVDGDNHGYEGQLKKDEIRQQRLESLRVRFLRFDDLDVKKDISRVVVEFSEKIQILTAKTGSMQNGQPTPSPSQEGNTAEVKK